MIAVPVAVLKIWAVAVSGICFLLGRQTHLSAKVVDRLVQNRALSTEKAVRDLGYLITPFQKGIQLTIAHLEKKTDPERKNLQCFKSHWRFTDQVSTEIIMPVKRLKALHW
jgi:hypothetical protein